MVTLSFYQTDLGYANIDTVHTFQRTTENNTILIVFKMYLQFLVLVQ